MARLILGTAAPQLAVPTLNAAPIQKKAALSPHLLETRLRQKRSAQFVTAILQLQAATHLQDTEALAAMKLAIAGEFPEFAIEQFPLLALVFRARPGYPTWMPLSQIADATSGVLGSDRQRELLSKARLLGSYDAALEQTCENYGAVLAGFAPRAFALLDHGSYAFVEIYPEYMLAVADSGNTSLVR
ncbi:hypothetical protein FY034_06825 [Trichlorobacter lovleyi]|uniref:hypothetical protein n=1 Tax=Trichlorobacter lovleyi TaxID=313985 RepID=UPI00223FEA6C|nr:hypothetical protein [Trichlorobacter lovleyi]QOX78648.1 hypothetical protein FY034_06825 [Trichlorobacter lovleyi]